MKSRSKHKMDNGKHEPSHENPNALLEHEESSEDKIFLGNDKVIDLKEAKSKAIYDDYTPTTEEIVPRTDHIIKHDKVVKLITRGANHKPIFIKCGSTVKLPTKRDRSVPSGNVNGVEIHVESDDTNEAPEVKKSKDGENSYDNVQNAVIESESVKSFDIENDNATCTPIAQEVGFGREIEKMASLNDDDLMDLFDDLVQNDLPIILAKDVENMDLEFNSNALTSSPKAPPPTEKLASLDGHNSSINYLNEQNAFDKSLHTKSDHHPSSPDFEKLPRESKAQNIHNASNKEKKSLKCVKLEDKDTLCGFIIHLLCRNEDPPVVKWIDMSEGVFKINDTSTFAKLWSQQKCKIDPMPFKNITRSIRTYYEKNILQNWEKEKNSWRFGDGADWKKLVT